MQVISTPKLSLYRIAVAAVSFSFRLFTRLPVRKSQKITGAIEATRDNILVEIVSDHSSYPISVARDVTCIHHLARVVVASGVSLELV